MTVVTGLVESSVRRPTKLLERTVKCNTCMYLCTNTYMLVMSESHEQRQSAIWSTVDFHKKGEYIH